MMRSSCYNVELPKYCHKYLKRVSFLSAVRQLCIRSSTDRLKNHNSWSPVITLEHGTTSLLLPLTKSDYLCLLSQVCAPAQNHKSSPNSSNPREHWRVWGLCGWDVGHGGVRWRWLFGIGQIFDVCWIVYCSLISARVPDYSQQICLHQLEN